MYILSKPSEKTNKICNHKNVKNKQIVKRTPIFSNSPLVFTFFLEAFH